MPVLVTFLVIAAALVLLVLAGLGAARDRLVDNSLVISGLVLTVLLLAHAVVGFASSGQVTGGEKATLAAYLVCLPIVPVATILLAIKDKTRWSMGVIAVGAFGVLVMAVRVSQIIGASHA